MVGLGTPKHFRQWVAFVALLFRDSGSARGTGSGWTPVLPETAPVEPCVRDFRLWRQHHKYFGVPRIMTGMPRGRPQEVTDKQLIEIAKATDGPSFTVSEVASKTPIDSPAVRERLDQLTEQGVLRVKKPGMEKIYWLPDGG